MQYTTDEQKHRHRMTSVRDKRQYRIAQGGFWFNIVALITAFVLVLVFIVLSAWLFYVKKEWWIGGGTLVVSFISFVKIFVRSKIKK